MQLLLNDQSNNMYHSSEPKFKPISLHLRRVDVNLIFLWDARYHVWWYKIHEDFLIWPTHLGIRESSLSRILGPLRKSTSIQQQKAPRISQLSMCRVMEIEIWSEERIFQCCQTCPEGTWNYKLLPNAEFLQNCTNFGNWKSSSWNLLSTGPCKHWK